MECEVWLSAVEVSHEERIFSKVILLNMRVGTGTDECDFRIHRKVLS